MSQNKYASQDKYVERMRKKGLTRMTVWVPEAARDELSKFAKNLCKGRVKPNEELSIVKRRRSVG